MKLTAFSVEKYRSIIKRSNFSVFDKTVIIGPNNEGKSNIMRALVCSLNILSVFAASPNMLRKEGKTIIYMPPLLGTSNIYSWQRDYPIPYQKTNGNIENKKSVMNTLILSEKIKGKFYYRGKVTINKNKDDFKIIKNRL